jgi:hypothetical protein
VRLPLRIRRHVFFRYAPDPEPTRISNGQLTVKVATRENLPDISWFRTPSTIEKYRSYLDNGMLGIFCYDGSIAVGHAWASWPPTDKTRVLLNGYFRPAGSWVLIHDCHVDAQSRGHGIFPFLVNTIASMADAQLGGPPIFIDTDRSNSASRRGIAKTSFTPCGHGTYITFRRKRLLGFQRISREAPAQ